MFSVLLSNAIGAEIINLSIYLWAQNSNYTANKFAVHWSTYIISRGNYVLMTLLRTISIIIIIIINF